MYRRRSTPESAIAFDRSCHLPDEVRQVDIHQAAASSDGRVTANDTRLLKRMGDAQRRGHRDDLHANRQWSEWHRDRHHRQADE